MNLEFGRSVESSEVSPFTDPREHIWDASSTFSSFLNLVLAELANRGLRLGFSSSRVDFTISRPTNVATEVLPKGAKY